MKFLDVPKSGKLGTVVAQQGRYGQILRPLGLTKKSRTPLQAVHRRIFGVVAARWKTLTSDQQLQWINAAPGYQSSPSCGQSGPLTGMQLFAKQNCINMTYGAELTETPAGKPTFPDDAITAILVTNTAGVIAIKATAPTDPGNNTWIRASAPQSNGRWCLPSCNIIGQCPAPVLGKADITAMYTAIYGTPAVGDKLFFQVYQVTDGHESQPQTFWFVVPPQA
jgi:hypothetical protein